MNIDAINLGIIKHLKNGRKSFKKIADKLGITENTVRTRVKNLKGSGILEISGLVDPDAVLGHSAVMIGVKLNTTDLVNKGREFSKLKGVVSVCVVTGRYDLMLTVLLKKDFGLLEFYTQEVANIDDVQSVETFVIYKAYNFKVPYIL